MLTKQMIIDASRALMFENGRARPGVVQEAQFRTTDEQDRAKAEGLERMARVGGRSAHEYGEAMGVPKEKP